MNLSNMPIEGKEFFREEFWAPPINFESRLRDKFNLQEKIYMHDVTLRDGEQTPGVAFTIDEKIMVAHELDKAGVGSIELGLPVISKDFEAMKVLAKEKTNAKMTCLVRAKKGDIDKAFADSYIVREDRFKTARTTHGYLEPPAALAYYDPSGSITIWAAKQSP